MLEKISRISCRFPWLVLVAVGVVTVFAIQQISENAHFEADLVKFLPTDMPAVKSDDYSKKNFNTQDTVLIGIEKKDGSALDPDALRMMENVVLGLKNLKAEKIFYSHLKGESVTLKQPVGLDADSVISPANLEDAILDSETGSVVTGSVVEKLKSDYNIPSAEGEEELLPKADADLLSIIPDLKERIMADRSFRGNVLSEDFKSATIRASTFRKQVYKRRYALLELSTAIDPQNLTGRFKGEDSTFPFQVYGKTINGTLIDDAYIEKHSAKANVRLHKYLERELSPSFGQEPELAAMFEKEMTVETFQAIMQYIERHDFFLNPEMGTWRSFMDSLYEFMLDTIDPFSLENLEFQIHNVKDMIDIAEIYYLTNELLEKHSTEGVKSYVAGNPVVIGIVSQMMSQDMNRMVPIAIGVVLLILTLSFKSVRGVLIPLGTVVLAVIWSVGLMAYLDIPLTISTSGLPIIILGIGTAYSIHLLNRYYEDSQTSKDKFAIVQRSIKHVGGAIFMAAVTTVAGFSSLATTSLTTIQHFGVFSAVGVVIALVLSFTFTPALLVLWKIPKRNPLAKKSGDKKDGTLSKYMARWSQMVINYPKTVLLVFLLLIGGSLFLMRNNYFEGSMMSTFKEDNVIFQSDKFLNKHLTGTTDINLIFNFRDKISLENASVREELTTQIKQVTNALHDVGDLNPELNKTIIAGLNQSFLQISSSLPQSDENLFSQITLIQDLLNEEYIVETDSLSGSETIEVDAENDSESLLEMEDGDLDALSDESAEDEDFSGSGLDGLADDSDDLGGLSDDMDEEDSGRDTNGVFSDLTDEQIAGLKELNRRLGKDESQWENTGEQIVALRSLKTTDVGITIQREINLLSDFLSVDIKQPRVLNKLENLHHALKNLNNPVVVIDDKTYQPTGMILTPVDYVRKYYKVFYHDDDPAYDRLPNVEKDGFTDKTLTDRSINGVVLNQALSADRDGFESMITPDLKEFQVKIMVRDGSTITIDRYIEQAMLLIREQFPEDDPYIASIRTGGGAFTSMQISKLLGTSQMKSIALSFLLVFAVTFFIFRSALGGLFSLIPLLFTVVLNFGFLAILGGEITMATMLVASVAIGIGVDYTIHFLERLKIQLRAGDDLEAAYTATVMTAGKAILVNATAVAAGFLVFLFSDFASQIMLGVLVSATMVLSSLGSLTLLPAVILKVRPTFLEKVKLEARKCEKN